MTIDADWFLIVLATFARLFGIDAFAKLKRLNQSAQAILFGLKVQADIPDLPDFDMGDLTATILGRRLVLRPDLVGIYGEARVTSFWSPPEEDLTPKLFSAVGIHDRFFQPRLSRPRRVALDPTYRIAYRTVRPSDGAELDAGTAWASEGQPFGTPIDMWDPANYLEESYTVEVSVERPPGSVLAQATQAVKVRDMFDRRHPFVRWSKRHFIIGGGMTLRQSAVHKTAIRERCKFCDIGIDSDRFGNTYSLQHIDELPPTPEDGLRDKLCDYCFPHGG